MTFEIVVELKEWHPEGGLPKISHWRYALPFAVEAAKKYEALSAGMYEWKSISIVQVQP